MRTYLLSLTALLLFSCPSRQGAGPAERAPKAVFIIVDGISADLIESLDPPVLDQISATGGYARAYVGGGKGTYSETPTISAVGYNSLLTGTWANKHNVWDNNIEAPNYHYADIFRLVENHRPEMQTAIFSTWTDNRTRLVGEGLPQTGNLKLDYAFDGLELDTVRYPHDDRSDYIRRIDEAVAAEAARYITANGPDLSWVYLQYTDDMGHRFGNSEEFYSAIRIADGQVGKIWSAIQQRESDFNEDWLIVVTTDHGRDEREGKHHGGQSDRERLTWIVTNARNLNERFRQTPAVVDIMPSICNHLGIPIPDETKKEMDGVPFIGPVDFSDLKAERKSSEFMLSWQDLSGDDSRAEVLIAETDRFREGGKDDYRKVGEVAIAEEQYTFSIGGESGFYKVLLKGPHHYLNAWVVHEESLQGR